MSSATKRVAGWPRSILAPLALAALAALGCTEPVAPAESAAAPRTPAGEARSETPAADTGYTGVVLARRTVEVRAATAGVLVRLSGRLGDHVERGQTVAVIEDLELDEDRRRAAAALDAAQADLRRARALLEQAESAKARGEELKDLISEQALDALEVDRRVAEAAVDGALARLEEQRAVVAGVEKREGVAEVGAPMAGRIAQRYVEAGERVTAQEAILRLVSTGPPLVRFAVPPAVAASLEPGRRLAVRLESGTSVEATLVRLAPEIDAPSRLVFAEAELDRSAPTTLQLGQGAVVEPYPETPSPGAAR